jgi:predicted nucleotidyltransferase
MNRAAIERTLRAFFETGGPGVMAAYLFGSVARGTSDAASDVDVESCSTSRLR